MQSQPSPVTTATTGKELHTEPAQKEPDAQGESKPASGAETEAVTQPGDGALAGTPAATEGTQTACDDQTGRMELTSDLKPKATVNPVDTNAKSVGRDAQPVKKQTKVVRDGRKYVPSKKAMVDPLKMDMSKPAGIPLTCEYFTLHVKVLPIV